MEFRKPYEGRARVSVGFLLPSMTKQSFKAECDINQILRKWQKTGLVEHVAQFDGRYDDVSGVVDYQDALGQVMAAEEAFASLPSGLRKRFENDPGKFMDFVLNDKNREEMRALGLLKEDPAARAVEHPDEPAGAI